MCNALCEFKSYSSEQQSENANHYGISFPSHTLNDGGFSANSYNCQKSWSWRGRQFLPILIFFYHRNQCPKMHQIGGETVHFRKSDGDRTALMSMARNEKNHTHLHSGHLWWFYCFDVSLAAVAASYSSLIGYRQLSEIWVVCERGDDVSGKGFRETSSGLIRQRWGTFVSSDSSGKQQQQHGASDQPECRRYRRNGDGGRLRGHPADAGVSRWWVEIFIVMKHVQSLE